MPRFTFQSDEAVAPMSMADSPEGTRRSGGRSEGARRRGRPPLMERDQVIALLRATSERGGLFRVHFEQPALYARARRLWGSWEGALRAAEIDYSSVIAEARRRSADTRRRRNRRPVSAS